MNLELPEVAVEFGDSAARAFRAGGGVDLCRAVEADPGLRDRVVAPMLRELGAFELRLGDDVETDFAAAELCRAAGRNALPYPVAAVLSSPDGSDRPLALVDPALPRADHGGLFRHWRAATIDGAASWEATPEGRPLRSKLGPYVDSLRLGADLGPAPTSGRLTLEAWQLLGTLEHALAMVVEHVTSRQQFGGPLSAFQSVQFQVADIGVAVQSLRELAAYTSWRVGQPGNGGLVDALALRMHALETATAVLRSAHQLHGAIGLCAEHDLSVLTRYAQPALRMPSGLEATVEHLLAATEKHGLDSLFGGRA